VAQPPDGAAYDPAVVPEAPLEQTDAGLVPAGPGWFVLNAREARWFDRPGRGKALALTPGDELSPQLGVNLRIVDPGEPSTMYHWEAGAEAFLVLYGEALAIVDGQERPLRQWDFVYCPPGTKHAFVGTGDGPCAILAMGARGRELDGEWGGYTVDELPVRHGAGVEEETNDAGVAYARFPEPQPTRYDEGWLP
jgi:uncharacterized cupin superfamily protein